MAKPWRGVAVVRLYGCTVHIQCPTADAWIRRYQELEGRAKDLMPAFADFGEYMVSGSIQRNFAAQGRPVDWATLSPAYAAWKARHFPGRKILELSGAMKAGFWWKATKQSLRIGSNKPYWIYHQKGTRTMPARVILLLQRADRGVLTRLVRRYLATREVRT